MTQFFETHMGRRFFEGTMPDLVTQLKRLNDNFEKSQRSPTRTLERIQEVLWPGGNVECEWKSDTISEVASVLLHEGFGPDGDTCEGCKELFTYKDIDGGRCLSCGRMIT